MSEENTAEEWLATEDPTNGDLPVTEFIGTEKDLSQTLPDEGDEGDEGDEPDQSLAGETEQEVSE